MTMKRRKQVKSDITSCNHRIEVAEVLYNTVALCVYRLLKIGSWIIEMYIETVMYTHAIHGADVM